MTTEDRIAALAAYLNVPPETITADEYGDHRFLVDDHPIKRGTSPEEAKRLVAQLRDVLRSSIGAATDNWTSGQGLPWRYDDVVAVIKRYNPEALAIGLHEVVNTLYFVSKETDDYESARDHQTTLREAFDGIEPVDRRTPARTNDGEYLVLTDEEADVAAEESICGSVWAFSAEFLANMTDLPSEVFVALQDKYEGANDAVLKLIEKTCGTEAFIREAVAADGRGISSPATTAGKNRMQLFSSSGFDKAFMAITGVRCW